MKFLGWRSLLEKTSFGVVTLGLILFGIFQGVNPYSFRVEFFFLIFEVLFINAVFSSLSFTAFLLFSSAVFILKDSIDNSDPERSNERSICCIIPTYKDSEVLEKSVGSLIESNYSELKILVVCEENDKKGIKKAKGLSEDEKVNFLINSKYPDSKAGAINYAAEQTDSEIIALFDADQRVPKEFLRRALSKLKDNDVVQGRHIPEPAGIVESLAYYESLIFNYVFRQPLSLLTGFKLVGSRSTVIERSAFERMDGYSEEFLTEDYEFTHRCYRERLKVAELFRPAVKEEAAHSLKDWWGQRKRWMKGYFQVFRSNFRHLFSGYKGYRSFLSLIISASSIFGSVLMLTLVSKFFLLLLLGIGIINLIPVTALLSVALILRFRDSWHGSVETVSWKWTMTPLIFPLFSLISIKAISEYLFRQSNSWYRVDKEN